MVRRSFTAVLEKNAVFTGDFETEPYEAAWATEARWFVRVLEAAGSAKVTAQISPDGLLWCDEGAPALDIAKPGLHSCALRDFGHWLRLRGEVAGGNVKVMIYLALKE